MPSGTQAPGETVFCCPGCSTAAVLGFAPVDLLSSWPFEASESLELSALAGFRGDSSPELTESCAERVFSFENVFVLCGCAGPLREA